MRLLGGSVLPRADKCIVGKPDAESQQALHLAEALVRGQPDGGKIMASIFEDKVKELV